MLFGSKNKNNTPEDEIKNLTRAELLELLIDQTKLVEKLYARNKRLSTELMDCKAELKRVASLEVIISRLEQIIRLTASANNTIKKEMEVSNKM